MDTANKTTTLHIPSPAAPPTSHVLPPSSQHPDCCPRCLAPWRWTNTRGDTHQYACGTLRRSTGEVAIVPPGDGETPACLRGQLRAIIAAAWPIVEVMRPEIAKTPRDLSRVYVAPVPVEYGAELAKVYDRVAVK